MGRVPFPVTIDVICRYACFLSGQFKSSASVRNYISGVKSWMVILGFDATEFYSPSLRLTLTGIEKVNVHIPNRKLPITPEILRGILSVLDLQLVDDVVFWSLLCMAFFGMFRKSQFVGISREKFSPDEQFTRSDFQFTQEGLLVSVKWGKTFQKHDRIRFVPLARLNSSLCPVLAFSRMLIILPALPSSPAFALPTKSGLSPLTSSWIGRKLHSVLLKLDLDSHKFSFHSLRRGGATLASLAGCSDSDICSVGLWASEVYRDYIQLPPKALFRVTLAMGRHLV